MKVLVATKDPLVFDVLANSAPNAEIISALDTGHMYVSLPTLDLAVVDYRDLVPHPFSTECLRALIGKRQGLRHCSSGEFLAAPEDHLPRPGAATRGYDLPPKRTIALTSYAGGTGKTSLALDTALHFASKTEVRLPLPVAVYEFTYGSSALNALVRNENPSIDQLMGQPELDPGVLHGVTLYPMDYEGLRSMPRERTKRYIEQQMSHHVLNVIDAIWPHGLASLVGDIVDLWIVLTTPRIDAVDNARKLHRRLAAEYGEDKVITAVNQMGGLGASLALMGLDRDLEIPQVQSTEVYFDGRIGREILGNVYDSLWDEYERLGRRRWRLFRRRSRAAAH